MPIGTATLWNTSSVLSEQSHLGTLLHGLFGYAQAPTVLQGVLYIAYLVIVGGYFFWVTRRPNKGQPVRSESQVLPQKA